MVLSMCACVMSISAAAPYTGAMRTRIDIASCGAGPRSPFNIARSSFVNSSIGVKAINYNPGMHRTFWIVAVAALAVALPAAQNAPSPSITILKPARVFDGDTMHEGWAVRVKGDKIDAAGPEASVAAAGATVIDLPGTTLTPGLVEGHSHILLHSYSEASWTDQVSKEG